MDTVFNFNLATAFRIFGFFAAIPFGYTWFRNGQRILITALLTLILSKPSTSSVVSIYTFPLEFILGFILGSPILLLVYCCSMFGALFDLGRGQSIAQIYDPITASSPSTSALLFQYSAIGLLLAGDVMVTGVATLNQSLELIRDPMMILERENVSVFSNLLGLSIMSALTFFIPIGLAFFVVEIMIGYLGQAIPKLSLMSDSFQLKSLAGFLLLILLLHGGTLITLQGIARHSLTTLLKAF